MGCLIVKFTKYQIYYDVNYIFKKFHWDQLSMDLAAVSKVIYGKI